MTWTRRNPNGLADGMIVRKVSQPSAVFRVSGDPDTGAATYVAITRGQRTVLRGNARNYRPETVDEADARTSGAEDDDSDDTVVEQLDVARTDVTDTMAEQSNDDGVHRDDTEGGDDRPAGSAARVVRPVATTHDDGARTDIGVLCTRLEEAVALVADGMCTPAEAAAIVRAAADLNWAVATEHTAATDT